MKVGTLHIALATIGCVTLAVPGMAQQTPEIIVEAARPAAPATQVSPGSKEKLPAVSLVSRVSYSDLDLSTHSGAVELEKRVKNSATEVCQQLLKLYPGSTEGETSCVQGTVKSGMAQANKAIADAEKAAKK
jgi:UrcA family protein